MVKSEDRRIGEHDYRITQLPVGPGRRLLVRLTKILGPAVGRLVGGADKEGKVPKSLGDLSLGSIGQAFEVLSSTMTEDDMDHVCAVLADYTELSMGQGKWVRLPTVIELHFAGKYDDLLRWIFASLEVNYASFFAGIGSAAASARAGADPAS